MKKRLNILCGLVFLAVFVSLIDAGMEGTRGFYEGYTSVPDEEPFDHAASSYQLCLRHRPDAPCDSVWNAKSGAYVPVKMEQIHIHLDVYWGWGYLLLQFILASILIAFSVYVLVSFIRFIRNVNKEKIFHWDNVRLLRKMGWSLLLVYLVNILFVWLSYWDASQSLELEHYTLNYSHFLSDPMLLEGAIALVAAEVFAIGLRLQEEQDLTI